MLFLPGVGAYDTGIKSLKKNNLIDAIKEVTEIKHRKILGICLGMQLMCSSSDEGKIKSGLNFFDLKISKLKKKGLKVPHIGFNKVTSYNGFSLSKNLDKNYFYFAHSYCAKIKNFKEY